MVQLNLVKVLLLCPTFGQQSRQPCITYDQCLRLPLLSLLSLQYAQYLSLALCASVEYIAIPQA
ncbi:TPA: hypothetical protein R8G50_004303 [Citrobacter freundii]|nr:hypothetical protein [Citrobacter freundii]